VVVGLISPQASLFFPPSLLTFRRCLGLDHLHLFVQRSFALPQYLPLLCSCRELGLGLAISGGEREEGREGGREGGRGVR